MISGFVAKKGLMTSIYTPEGKRIAVTQLVVAPLKVVQVKTEGKDGYQAVQVAYGSRKNLDKATSSKLNKLKLDIKPSRFKEFFAVSDTLPEVGSDIAIDAVLTVGDKVDVTGTTKGRGFAGVIKRYGFQRQPVSGGQSDRVRAPGAIGAQTPGKVIKGKRMPGHYGNASRTVIGLKVIAIDTQTNTLTLSGSVPGSINSWVTIIKK
ncbi:MAG TPA: 50S ribosomal protein L3 [Patescibacteria group bacterium]